MEAVQDMVGILAMSEVRAKLDSYGIDGVCNAICNEKPLTTLADEIGVSIGSLLMWIEADPERSARAREARIVMARRWDEKSEEILTRAEDDFALKKAKELSHHYRWRASKIAPRDYGDKTTLEHTGEGGGPVKYQNMAPADLDAEIARLQALVGKP